MNLKDIIISMEINEYNRGVDIFLKYLSEGFSTDKNTILVENISSACMYKPQMNKDGTPLLNSTGNPIQTKGLTDTTSPIDLENAVKKIKGGETHLQTPAECLKQVIQKLTGIDMKDVACNKKEDNPTVKDNIIANIDKILLGIQKKIDALPQPHVPKQLMKSFQAAFDIIKAQKEPAI